MIELNSLGLFLESMVSLAVLSILLLKFWSAARLDAYRQEMFVVRDELFDFAADGNIPFDSPAYKLLRQMMNGFIRFGHQLSFFRMAATAIEIKLLEPDFVPTWSLRWEKAMSEVEPDVRQKLEEFHARAWSCSAQRLVFGSPFLLLVSLLVIPLLLLRQGWDNLKQIFAETPSVTLSHLLDARIIENEAAAAAVA